MPHPAARLREARELPRIHGLEEWGGAGFTGGEDDQCRTEVRRGEEGDAALAILSSSQGCISVEKERQCGVFGACVDV